MAAPLRPELDRPDLCPDAGQTTRSFCRGRHYHYEKGSLLLASMASMLKPLTIQAVSILLSVILFPQSFGIFQGIGAACVVSGLALELVLSRYPKRLPPYWRGEKESGLESVLADSDFESPERGRRKGRYDGTVYRENEERV